MHIFIHYIPHIYVKVFYFNLLYTVHVFEPQLVFIAKKRSMGTIYMQGFVKAFYSKKSVAFLVYAVPNLFSLLSVFIPELMNK